MGAQRPGGGGAGEGEDVLLAEQAERRAHRTGDHLQVSGRQHAGVRDDPDRVLGEVGGQGGRLHHAGHARQHGLGELLQRRPHREVEGVHLEHQARGGADEVDAQGVLAPGEAFGGAFHEVGPVRQLGAGAGRVVAQDADAAVDVVAGVVEGGAGAGREGVQLFTGGARTAATSASRRSARRWKLSARSAVPPARRAWSNAPARSRPWEETRHTVSPVTASCTSTAVVSAADGATQVSCR
ncbi:putative uncharacterized protein [Streptomyces azureus]|uniref:Uncharacterized protein n=1 Tax=Streptomyces azureus TaxID=146537 RepID=A0A0K8PRS6_STRAJ|nr:putative uncharacterized protein [Streptomyces azureus]